MNTAVHRGLHRSRIADLVLSEDRLSDSLPNLYKINHLQPLKGKVKTTTTWTPSLEKTVLTRVATVRQGTPRSAPLKKIHVMEQRTINHTERIQNTQ